MVQEPERFSLGMLEWNSPSLDFLEPPGLVLGKILEVFPLFEGIYKRAQGSPMEGSNLLLNLKNTKK